jgi:hypothetical protein
MFDSGLRRFFWRIVDHLDYVLTLVRLRILDAVAGPLPRRRRINSGSGTESDRKGRSPKSSRKERRAALSLEPISAGRGNGANLSQLR